MQTPLPPLVRERRRAGRRETPTALLNMVKDLRIDHTAVPVQYSSLTARPVPVEQESLTSVLFSWSTASSVQFIIVAEQLYSAKPG